MRLSTATSVIVCCQAAATLNGAHAFVISKSSIHRAASLSEGRGSTLRADTTDQLERIVEGPVVDLRGGKTTGKKASSSKGKESSSAAKGKSSKTSSKSKKKGPKRPSFVATIKAFFHSLINPHFALKLQAKKEQHNTVHGSGSA